MGYRRPKNLRDSLVHASIPRLPGDETVDPNTVQIPIITITADTQQVVNKTQKDITDYFTTGESDDRGLRIIPSTSSTSSLNSQRRRGTDPAKRGFPFCKKTFCKFCKKLNKSGKIKSNTTGKEYTCMKNISCRSSNVIYCISCIRCGMQYVGQTLLRLTERFAGHQHSIREADDTKSVGRHFSQKDHKGTFDLEISVLEFIKKPPKSEAAQIIRDRVERRWIHLLRTKAPQGLNIED